MGTVSSAKVIAIPSMGKTPGAGDRSHDGSSRKSVAGHPERAEANS